VLPDAARLATDIPGIPEQTPFTKGKKREVRAPGRKPGQLCAGNGVDFSKGKSWPSNADRCAVFFFGRGASP